MAADALAERWPRCDDRRERVASRAAGVVFWQSSSGRRRRRPSLPAIRVAVRGA